MLFLRSGSISGPGGLLDASFLKVLKLVEVLVIFDMREEVGVLVTAITTVAAVVGMPNIKMLIIFVRRGEVMVVFTLVF